MQTKDIRVAAQRMIWALDSAMINYAQRLIELCAEEERGHRGCLPEFTACHTTDTIGVKDAARLFAVKRVAEYLNGARLPAIADYLHTQKSCYMAAAIAAEYGPQIREEWKDLDIHELARLDYTEFVKTRKVGE